MDISWVGELIGGQAYLAAACRRGKVVMFECSPAAEFRIVQ